MYLIEELIMNSYTVCIFQLGSDYWHAEYWKLTAACLPAPSISGWLLASMKVLLFTLCLASLSF
jgi:hypothetical protein